MMAGPATPPTSSSVGTYRLLRRLRRGGLWIVAGRTAGMAMVLAAHLVLARVLPTKDYAAFVLASSIVAFCSMTAMFGLNTLVCRYVAESLGLDDPGRARKAIRVTGLVGAVCVVTVGLLAWIGITRFAEPVFQLPQLSQSAGLMAVWVALLAISQFLAEVFRGFHDLRMASVLGGVTGGSAASALFLVSVVAGSFFIGLDFPTVVVMAATSLLLPILGASVGLIRWWPREMPSARGAAHDLEPLSGPAVVREAFPIMLVQTLAFALAQVDIWIVGVCCGNADLAVYGVVRRLALLVAIPLTQVELVVASSISELNAQGDRQRLEWTLRGAATISILVSGLVAAGLFFLAPLVLGVGFGPTFRAGTAPLRILCLGQIVFALTGPCGPALMMTGRQRCTLWSLIAVIPIFFLTPWAAGRLGLEAVAAVAATANMVRNAIQWVVVRIRLGIRTHPFLGPVSLPKLCSVLRLAAGSGRRGLARVVWRRPGRAVVPWTRVSETRAQT